MYTYSLVTLPLKISLLDETLYHHDTYAIVRTAPITIFMHIYLKNSQQQYVCYYEYVAVHL